MNVKTLSLALAMACLTNAHAVLSNADILQSALKHKDMICQEDCLINNSKNRCRIPLHTTLKRNGRFQIMVQLPRGAYLSLTTGRGQERLSLSRRQDNLIWSVFDANGNSLNKPENYWWENVTYTPNHQVQDSFSFPDDLRAWNNFYSETFHRDLDQTFLPLTLETGNGKLRFFLDHILLTETEVTEDLFDKQPTLELSFQCRLKDVTNQQVTPLPSRFYTVNLTRRFNAKDAEPRLETQPGKPVHVQGIPFEQSPKSDQGYSHVDVGQSWFREGTLPTYETPSSGTFGGRWRGALSNNPTRIQFRIPCRPYTNLYLLVTCPSKANHIPAVTAQFFQTSGGFPKNFKPAEAIKVGNDLQIIRIPVTPELLKEFFKRRTMELELISEPHIYRPAPDPGHYSVHGGGLPSAVQVYAMTLESDPVEVMLTPQAFGNVWQEQNPAYQVTLTNHTDQPQYRRLVLVTRSFDGQESLKQTQDIALNPRQSLSTRFDLPLRKYGFHKVTLTCNGRDYQTQLTKLRRRTYRRRPFDAKGFMFGFWNWSGTHDTLNLNQSLRLMGILGMESLSNSAALNFSQKERQLARRYGMKTFWAYEWGFGNGAVTTPEAAKKYLQEKLLKASDLNEPIYINLFAEPGGLDTHGTFPEFYGEESAPMTDNVKKLFEKQKRRITIAHQEIKALTPDAKILMPWGDPVYAVPFLKDPETRNLFDGVAIDIGYFDRLPEQQLHQCSIHRMYQFMTAWKKYRKDPPTMITIEGPCVAAITPGALNGTQKVALVLRSSLMLAAYGVNRQFAITSPNDCSSYWGEQHYGGGCMSRNGNLYPHEDYAALGTLIRHLRDMEFVASIPTGSLSTYCLQFKNAKNGRLLHVLWTIRGKRLATMKHTQIYDVMDNLIPQPVLSPLPIFVYGNDGKLTLQKPDHSDMKLAKHTLKLGNLATMNVTQTQQADDEYVNAFPIAIRRFPATMKLDRTNDGLSVTLPPQQKERLTMPYYTALVPPKPIPLPGNPRFITLDVTAHSDWGRVAYVLRDAKGERWISVGQKDNWNCDDTPGDSVFNFDGKRLVRFELPRTLPWDQFRDTGFCWWGHYDGDGSVDLPLTLEKIYVERRRHILYVNSLVRTSDQPVHLGNLYLEYDSQADMTNTQTIRRPLPPNGISIANPIADLERKATLPPTEILKVQDPPHYYDGTRGIFTFRTMPNAVSYDIYLSLKPSGEQAIRLGKNLKKSGVEVHGFRANTTFYAFIVYRDKAGHTSHPSKPFQLKMIDTFGNK